MASRGSSDRPGEGPNEAPSTSERESPPDEATASAPGDGPRETVLGSADRLKFCSRCQAVRYCSSACQKDDVSKGKGGMIYMAVLEIIGGYPLPSSSLPPSYTSAPSPRPPLIPHSYAR